MPQTYLTQFNERFDKEFVYDLFDDTGLKILGNREYNYPVSDEEIKSHFHQELVRFVEEEIEKKLPTKMKDKEDAKYDNLYQRSETRYVNTLRSGYNIAIDNIKQLLLDIKKEI